MDELAHEICACRQTLVSYGHKYWGRALNSDDIEDFAQETIAIALKSRHNFRGESAVATWLIAIFRLRAISYLRRLRESVSIDQIAPDAEVEEQLDVPGMTVEPLQEVEYIAAQETARLRQLVDALPEAFRTIVQLHYYDNMAGSDMALRLGMPEGSIKSRLFYARKKLRAALA